MHIKGVSISTVKAGRFGVRPSCIIAATLFTLALPVRAALITFDDLPTNSGEPTELIDQYAALGVTFGGAAVDEDHWDASVSSPNVASDHYGPGMSIQFTGALPNFVSLYVSTAWEQSAYISFRSTDGQVTHFVTDGWRGLEELSTLYRDRQLVSFSGADISHVYLGEFYGRRGSLLIDDLMFDHIDVEVSEPPMMSLLTVALLLLLRDKRRHQPLG